MRNIILLSYLLSIVAIPVFGQEPKTDSIAENMLVYQRACGGWPKHVRLKDDGYSKVNYKLVLTKEEKAKIMADSLRWDATYDNNATCREIRHLIKAYSDTKNEQYLKSAERGIEYILAGQYESGGWPQFYPLVGGYADYITYNDNAMINNLSILENVVRQDDGFEVVNSSLVGPCEKAIDNTVRCILKTQIIYKGKPTVWCAQHHNETLLPAKARSYELKSFSGSESVGIVRFLMGVENPSDSVIKAVDAAIAWFQANKIIGFNVIKVDASETERGYDKVMVDDPGNELWARFYDLETCEPYVCGRDGIKKDSLADIEYERRVGYRWYGTWPKSLIEEEYPRWKKNLSTKP